MFLGWLSYGGAEVWNSSRTVAYAQELLPGVSVQDCNDCGDLAEVLGDKVYSTPLVDQPDWFDPYNSHTWEFAGVLPLSVEGVEDSTVSTSVTDLIGGGGYVAPPLPRAREMRFTALLLGADDAAVEAGMTWLKHALGRNPCSTQPGCNGEHLCYLAACPQICDETDVDTRQVQAGRPLRAVQDESGRVVATSTDMLLCPWGEQATDLEACVADYMRHLRHVTTTSGPTVVEKLNPTCGAIWQVEWTMVAGTPDPYSASWYVGSTALSDGDDTGDVVRWNLAPNPRGRVGGQAGWTGGGVESWDQGYIAAGGELVAGFVRRNFALDPRATRLAVRGGTWGYRPGSDYEISRLEQVTGRGDGPLALPGGRRVSTYVRSTFTRTDGSAAAWYDTRSGLELDGDEVWTGSVYARRSQAGRVRAVVDTSAGLDPQYGPWLDVAANEWVRVSATDTVVLPALRTNEHINPRLQGAPVGPSGVSSADVASGAPDGGSYRQGTLTADVGNSTHHIGHSVTYAVAIDPANPPMVSAYAMRSAGGEARLFVRRYDAAGNQLGADAGSPVVTLAPGVWGRVTYDLPAQPAEVASILVRVAFMGAKAAGDTINASQVLIEEQDSPEPGTYFDGSTPDTESFDYAWAGAVNASVSTRTFAPAGGTPTARMAVELEAPGTGETFDATAMLIQEGADLDPYFDPTLGTIGSATFAWESVANASPSLVVPHIPDSPELVGFAYATAAVDATGTVSGIVGAAGNRTEPVTAFASYGVRMWVYVPQEAPAELMVQILSQWYGPDGDPYGAPRILTTAQPATPGWNLFTGRTVLAPDGTAALSIYPAWAGWTASSSQVPQGRTVAWAARIIEENVTPADYFDGDSPDQGRYENVWVDGDVDGLSEVVVASGCVVVPQVACVDDPSAGVIVPDGCSPLPLPPLPPDDLLDPCLGPLPSSWCRYSVLVPGGFVPNASVGVPIVRIRTEDELSMVRVRFYPNPLSRAADDLPACGYCGEFLVAYVPKNSVMLIDSSTQDVEVTGPGGLNQTGSHLVYASDGGPMQWPELVCGMPFTMVVDVAPTGAPEVEVSLCVAWRL